MLKQRCRGLHTGAVAIPEAGLHAVPVAFLLRFVAAILERQDVGVRLTFHAISISKGVESVLAGP